MYAPRANLCDDHKRPHGATFVVSYGAMFVKWSSRSRDYTLRHREPHRTLVAQLIESRRVDGKPKKRTIAHLGTCREPVDRPRHRAWFYKRCDRVLDRLALDPDDRAKIEDQLAARIPRPNGEERADDAWAATFRPPDGFTALVNAWNGASENEQRRFLGELRAKLPLISDFC